MSVAEDLRLAAGPDWASVTGYVHSVETAGTVDGPGVRFVVFLSGCPLRCLYCHNPDTQRFKAGTRRTAGEVVAEIAEYRDFLERAHGGVTLTGGEPLAQPAFVHAILHGLKELGLHTALDTSGYLGRNATREMLDLVDLVLLDIKSFEAQTYRKVTGVDLTPTLRFARRLCDLGKRMWIRFVLVPGLTDAPENVEGLAAFAQTLTTVDRVEVLPFHKMGEFKYEALGMPYLLKDTKPPSQALIERVRGQFRKHKLPAV